MRGWRIAVAAGALALLSGCVVVAGASTGHVHGLRTQHHHVHPHHGPKWKWFGPPHRPRGHFHGPSRFGRPWLHPRRHRR